MGKRNGRTRPSSRIYIYSQNTCKNTIQMKNIKLNLRVASYPLGVDDIDYSGGGDWLPSLGSLQNPYVANRKVRSTMLPQSLSVLGFQLQHQACQANPGSLDLSQARQLEHPFQDRQGGKYNRPLAAALLEAEEADGSGKMSVDHGGRDSDSHPCLHPQYCSFNKKI